MTPWTVFVCAECGAQVVAETDRDTGTSWVEPKSYLYHFHGDVSALPLGWVLPVREVEVVPANGVSDAKVDPDD